MLIIQVRIQILSVTMSLKNVKKVTDQLKICNGIIIDYTEAVIKNKESIKIKI